MTRAPSASMAERQTVAVGWRRCMLFQSIPVMHPAAPDLEVYDREEQDEGEQHPGHRTREAHMKIPEGLLVEVQAVEQRRAGRTPGRGLRLRHAERIGEVEDQI